jgi:hypothetical protein
MEPKRQTQARSAIETESMTNEEAAIKDAASPRPREAAKA